jgi:uncharacterized protein YvpB
VVKKVFKLKQIFLKGKNFLQKHRLIVRISLGALTIALISTFFMLKTAMAIYPSLLKNDFPVDQPLVIDLNQAIRDIDIENIKISPATTGKWSFESGGILGNTQLIFNHDENFRINTLYTIEFGGITRLLLGDERLPKVSFKTQSAPSLAGGGINDLSDGDKIAANYIFKANLQSANQNLRDLELRIEPAQELDSSVADDKHYSWKPKTILPQGHDITVELFDKKNNLSLKKLSLRVVDEPRLKNPVHTDHFGGQEIAKIEFNQPVNRDTTYKIVFDIDGEGKWESDTVYTFKPTKVEPGKTYSYHIKAGLRSKEGGVLTHDIDASFTTVGEVTVTGSSPTGKELKQSSQVIKFTFDQSVDHASAEQRFSISSGQTVGFSWSGNTMSVTVKELGFQRTVTATIAAGVKNSGFGLPSSRAFSTSFTTEIRTIKLAVPYFRQEHSASCSIATTRMALNYHGVNVGEMDILGRMNYNPRAMDRANNTWDDPREMFVGFLDGKSEFESLGTEIPLLTRVLSSYGRGTSEQSGDAVNVNWIAEEIHNGHPVIISGTGTLRAPTYSEFTASNGRRVRTASNGHSRIVYGVRGEPTAPITFYIYDPTSGSLSWSASKLNSNLRSNPYGGQAVAVY